MAEPVAFFLDQHFPGAVTRALQRLGLDVLTAQDAGRCALPDIEQLEYAASEQRVVVTFDVDFLALHRAGIEHAGIAWCHERKYSIGELIQALLLVHAVLDRDNMKNHVEYL